MGRQMLEAAAGHDDAEVVQIADVEPTALHGVAARHDEVRRSSHPLHLLADRDLDAVYIAARPSTHESISRFRAEPRAGGAL